MGTYNMKSQNMFGVVLWSDAAAQKAVIWCEDQGELAYYTPGDSCIHEAPLFDAGDLIQFDLTVQHNIRKATNPQLLMQSHSPDLPKRLQAGQVTQEQSEPAGDSGSAKKIIDIATYFEREPVRKIA